jgi:hypothetical protein
MNICAMCKCDASGTCLFCKVLVMVCVGAAAALVMFLVKRKNKSK